MKLIYLLRHAKSSWDNTAASDLDRVLNERGLRAALMMGEYAQRNGIRPEAVYCSIAARTRGTAAIFLPAAGISIKPTFTEKIYEATSGELLNLIIETDDAFSSLLLIGHNPGIEGLTCALTGKPEMVPTAALITISAEVNNWADIAFGRCELVSIIRPKEL